MFLTDFSDNRSIIAQIYVKDNRSNRSQKYPKSKKSFICVLISQEMCFAWKLFFFVCLTCKQRHFGSCIIIAQIIAQIFMPHRSKKRIPRGNSNPLRHWSGRTLLAHPWSKSQDTSVDPTTPRWGMIIWAIIWAIMFSLRWGMIFWAIIWAIINTILFEV